MRHVILISGKDSLATAIVQRRKESLPYEFVFNVVGWELPETLVWINDVERYLGQPIIRLGDDLTEICNEQNCLPLAQRRFCTKYAKIKPLNDYLGAAESMVYFGLRADEPERIGYVQPAKQKLKPIYPLREAGLGLREVWGLCKSVGLLPPQFHWPWMESRVREMLGCDSFLLDELPEWERYSLLAWRSRNNCDRCFYQRLYERIGLSEFHPDLFESSCLLEERLCHKPEFTWVQGYRLRDLLPRSKEIKAKRAKAIVGHLRDRQQKTLFDGESFTDDLLATSCGLLCGK